MPKKLGGAAAMRLPCRCPTDRFGRRARGSARTFFRILLLVFMLSYLFSLHYVTFSVTCSSMEEHVTENVT